MALHLVDTAGLCDLSSRPAQCEKVPTAGMCAAAMNFMTNSTVANNGRSGSIQSQEQGSNPSARASHQQSFQRDVPDSAYTNGHTPPHATSDISGDSEGRTVPAHAERQGSYEAGQRADGWGSHGRYAHALLCLWLSHKQHSQSACMSFQSVATPSSVCYSWQSKSTSYQQAASQQGQFLLFSSCYAPL